MLTFVLWKWNKPSVRVDFRRRRVVYTAEHVNKVCSMLRRHCTTFYKVICLTDDPSGVECETQPIPAPELLKYGACWNRLWLFSPEATRLGDQLVSLDLDTVIVDNINPLFTEREEFKIWRGSYPNIAYCGSIWMLRAGALPWVWTDFLANQNMQQLRLQGGKYQHQDCVRGGFTVGSDQAWIALKLPGRPVWTSADGVISYRLEAQGALPPGARIVNFHGLEDPSLTSCQNKSPWIEEHWR